MAPKARDASLSARTHWRGATCRSWGSLRRGDRDIVAIPPTAPQRLKQGGAVTEHDIAEGALIPRAIVSTPVDEERGRKIRAAPPGAAFVGLHACLGASSRLA